MTVATLHFATRPAVLDRLAVRTAGILLRWAHARAERADPGREQALLIRANQTELARRRNLTMRRI